ncbi:phage tail assembly chaperone [Chromobacterium violaceum]|uniref:phage tail assembly chaperone n=1 Tax=Chromobacterium violaceum TaxID=536 RepID=UPI0035A6951B
MAYFTSVLERAWYNTDIYPIHLLPEDAEEITQAIYEELLAGQEAGKMIDFSTSPPTLIERPAPPREMMEEDVRIRRNQYLSALDSVVIRNADEIAMGISPTLTADQIKQVLLVRQALRGITEQPGFPYELSWPDIPSFTK